MWSGSVCADDRFEAADEKEVEDGEEGGGVSRGIMPVELRSGTTERGRGSTHRAKSVMTRREREKEG